MGLSDFIFYYGKNVELSDEQIRWSKLWKLWAAGQVDSPFTELMTYQSEINNGGHNQFFSNVENTGDLQKTLAELKTVLSTELQHNLQKAYIEYLSLKENESDESTEKILEQCDDTFYVNEAHIIAILKEYAKGITL